MEQFNPELYYDAAGIGKTYTHTPTGNLNVSRVLQGLPPWEKSVAQQKMPKHIVIAAELRGAEINAVVTLIKQGFSVSTYLLDCFYDHDINSFSCLHNWLIRKSGLIEDDMDVIREAAYQHKSKSLLIRYLLYLMKIKRFYQQLMQNNENKKLK